MLCRRVVARQLPVTTISVTREKALGCFLRQNLRSLKTIFAENQDEIKMFSLVSVVSVINTRGRRDVLLRNEECVIVHATINKVHARISACEPCFVF